MRQAPITLALAGDVMLGRLVNETILREGFAYPWGDVLPLLQSADLFLINLECALTAETRRWYGSWPKPFHFRAEPEAVATLKAGRVDFVSVANNHIGDFGVTGLLDTLASLDRAGIAHAGAGANLAAARAPARLTAGGLRISVVAFADHPAEWAAGGQSPGMNYTPISLAPDVLADVTSVIAAARQDADLLICSLHWGPNMRARPAPIFREFAYRLVDAGVDIVWGHSAHVVQGIEAVNGALVLYDTGDFVDDYAVNPELRNDLSALFLVRIGDTGIERLELVPVRIDQMQVRIAGPGDRQWITRRVAGLCEEMGTALREEPGALSLPLRGAGWDGPGPARG